MESLLDGMRYVRFYLFLYLFSFRACFQALSWGVLLGDPIPITELVAEEKYWKNLSCCCGKGKLTKREVAEIEEVDVFYGKQHDEYIRWKVLQDSEHISKNHLNVPETPILTGNFDFGKQQLDNIFLDELWPSINPYVSAEIHCGISQQSNN